MLGISLINILIVIVVVLVHYEFLYWMTALMPRIKAAHRFRIVLGVAGALLAHAVEVWVFAFAYYFMHHSERWGSLQGNFDGSLRDCVYFSFTVFSTLGFGDIEAVGLIRFLTGVESLAGLVLITWSASFLFVEMQRYWTSR